MMIMHQEARIGPVRIVIDCTYVYKSRYAGRVSMRIGFASWA
jgi:hypothetical protein